MGDKIYLVKSGEYSDTEIHGYCTDEAQAAKYCKLKNEIHSYDEYYTEECEHLDDIDLSRVKIQYLYKFALDSEFRVMNSNVKPEISYSAEETASSFSDTAVCVCLKEENAKKALKIAYDLACQTKQCSIEKELYAESERQRLFDALNDMKEQFEKTH